MSQRFLFEQPQNQIPFSLCFAGEWEENKRTRPYPYQSVAQKSVLLETKLPGGFKPPPKCKCTTYKHTNTYPLERFSRATCFFTSSEKKEENKARNEMQAGWYTRLFLE